MQNYRGISANLMDLDRNKIDDNFTNISAFSLPGFPEIATAEDKKADSEMMQ